MAAKTQDTKTRMEILAVHRSMKDMEYSRNTTHEVRLFAPSVDGCEAAHADSPDQIVLSLVAVHELFSDLCFGIMEMEVADGRVVSRVVFRSRTTAACGQLRSAGTSVVADCVFVHHVQDAVVTHDMGVFTWRP